MAIESPHQGGWAALGFGGGMIGSPAVIATTTAANGGIGVFNLEGYSSGAITEYAGAVADSSGSRRRLADTSADFTITDVRPPHSPVHWMHEPCLHSKHAVARVSRKSV